MLLFLHSKDKLAAAREALIGLGLECSVMNHGETIVITVNNEGSLIPASQQTSILSQFGNISAPASRTPCLDRLASNHSVIIDGPKGTRVEFTSNGGAPVWISGPCAVESRESLEDIAAFLSNLGVKVLRGGAVKPRTSPHDFQGVGREGFRWLADVAHRFGMLAVSEALSEDDVEEALEYLDIVQIGARNMQNFSLLKKLARGNRPIILKRAPGATLKEWALAAEYLVAGGNTKVILCERGVRGLERELRYTLDMAGAAWMQQRYHLPVIVDPSHATGNKFLLGTCTRGALAMGLSGVMLEVHPRPVDAKSDALQALTFPEFALVFSQYRASTSPLSGHAGQTGLSLHC
jgi:3-deoxy-7-phosphoheptulonate synthase